MVPATRAMPTVVVRGRVDPAERADENNHKLLAQVPCRKYNQTMLDDDRHDEDAAAVRLAVALKRLRARLREESGTSAAGLSLSQLSILQRLRLDGPATAASLAAAEHVSQQAIAQGVAPLKVAGLVGSKPDPDDGRKTLISITDAGLGLRESIIASRHSWLSRAIESTVDARERAALEKTIELLERLADAEA